ncbi:glutamic acid-rich protein-like isoform X2 [Bacillus rossius redtenbacheri]
MKKKISEDSDNEFSVDEPEELQGSDDDWTPEAGEEKRRSSRRLRNAGAKKPRLTEPSTSEEEEEDSDGGKKGKARKGKPAAATPKQRGRPIKKPQITPVPTGKLKAKPTPDNIVSCEATSTTGVPAAGATATTEKEFTSGAFVVLKTDMVNPEGDPPIWKIDGKALLQKYVPFQQDGKTLYKNTSTYSGWSTSNRDSYYPAPIVFKMQNRKETIVEFLKDNVKVGEIKEKEKSSEEKEPQQAENEGEGEDEEEVEDYLDEEEEEEEVEDIDDEEEEDDEDGVNETA